MAKKAKVGIIGPGNIGMDLMIKIARSELLEVKCVVNVKESPGLEMARNMGADVSAKGVDYMVEHHKDLDIVFEATGAAAHIANAPKLQAAGYYTIDLTPAAVGPYCVPVVNLNETLLNVPDVNMVTCAGQATVPIVSAINRVADVAYAEVVSSISSLSAGPGTRANIDEFTVTTRKALETIGGADSAKVIIILNPAEPPINMRNTIYTRVKNPDISAIRASVADMVAKVREYVPGYRVLLEPILEGDIVTTMIEVQGLGDYLPSYAGNLDIITSAAVFIGEQKARELGGKVNE